MLFHTWIFAAFFLLVWPVYLAVRRTRLRDGWLLGASYVFYGWWNPLYLVLIVRCTVFDYVAVRLMARTTRPRLRKLWLALSVACNLAVLGVFKYGRFLTDNLNDLLASAGIQYALPAPGVLLPVGISFYTFQSMSYTIDYYRGRIDAEPSLVRFATFVALFPQLVAGPIERASNLLPQLRTPREIHGRDLADGLSMFVVGLFKKVALADYLALYVDRVYDAPEQYRSAALIAATVAFGWQIYFDFSGYTDMARGIGRFMGFRLMLNFRNPYLAAGLGEFWQRWHVSLSTWFRDYVYIPLGGNRGGTFRTYRNMVLTMLVSGLWHGAAWTFVIWGALHAAGRVLTRRLETTDFYNRTLPKPVRQLLVFAFVTFTWIFFRAHSLGDAWLIVTRIFSTGWADPRFPLLAAALIAAVWAYQIAFESGGLTWRFGSGRTWTFRPGRLVRLAPVRVAIVVLMILYLAMVPAPGGQPFIYFQF